MSVTYTPAANYNGPDSFTYTISDGHGGFATATVTVTVTPVNDDPVAVADAITVAEDSGTTTVNVLANDNGGPDVGETLTVSAVTQGAHGAVTFTATGVAYTPAANFNGPDSFTYTISDGNGGTSTATVTVTVTPVNDNPVAVADAAALAEDTAVTINVLANDTTGPDAGETLTVSAVTQGAHGAVTFNGASVTYTPAANFNGPDSFTYTISDGNGGTSTATVTVTVTPVNDPPVAVADATTVAEDSGATAVNVLANDTTGPDVGETLAVVAVTQGANGSVLISAGGAGVTYTPAANFAGTDTFSYTVSDGNGGTATAFVTVTVTPANDAPVVAVTALPLTYTENAPPAVVDPTLTVSDVDNTTLAGATVTVVGYAAGEDVLALPTPIAGITATFDAATGVLTLTGTASVANYQLALRTVTYANTSDNPTVGPRSLAVVVSDGTTNSTPSARPLTVVAVNDAPVAVADAVTVAEDSGATTFNVLTNDTDPENDALTVTGVTQAANGVVTFTGTGVTYTPAANFNGPDTFTYTISDGNGGTSTATVSVTVTPVPDAPVATDDTATTNEDTPVAVDVLANDTDADGNALSVTAVTQGAHGVVTFTGSGVTYTPATNYDGTDTFTYTVSDGTGLSATATVTVTVTPVNDPPVAVDDAATTAEDTPVTVAVLANDTDSDADPLTVTAVTQGTHGSVVIAGDKVVYTPAADYNGADRFTYTISDGNGGTSTATVNVTVTPVNDAPVARPDAVTTDEDTAVAVTVRSNDTDVDGDALTVVAVGPAAHGTATTDGQTVTYMPAPNYNGPDSFSYTVSDGHGGTATATVTVSVTPVADPPVVVDDAYSLSAASLSVPAGSGLLANDIGPGPVAVVSFTPPAHGTATVNPDGSFVYTPAVGYYGPDSFTYTATSSEGASATGTVTIDVSYGQPRSNLYGSPVYSVGAGAGGSPAVQTYAGLATTPAAARVVGPADFRGGVRTATGDVTGDGVPDLVTVTGPGTAAVATVYDGVTGQVVRSFAVFEAGFTGGAYVAVADFNHDRVADIAVSADVGGGPRIVIYDGRTGELLTSFFGIEDPAFRGGARIAAGDLNGDGYADLVVAAGADGGPRVAGFDGRTVLDPATRTKLFSDFFAFDPALRNGVYVAIGDVDGDGKADLIAGAGPGGGPNVRIFSGDALTTTDDVVALDNFFSGDDANRGGVRVAVTDADGDNRADLVTGSGAGAGSVVRVYLGKGLGGKGDAVSATYNPFDDLADGVYVG